MTTTKIGKWKEVAIDREGRKNIIILTNDSYIPDLMVNLFSLTSAMEQGDFVNGSKDGSNLHKGNWMMTFDGRGGTPKGHLFATSMIPETKYNVRYANVLIQYERAHQMLGHPGRNLLPGTAARLNWNISKKTSN
jgi:hypothetical protein